MKLYYFFSYCWVQDIVNIFSIYTIKINFLIFFILRQFIQILEYFLNKLSQCYIITNTRFLSINIAQYLPKTFWISPWLFSYIICSFVLIFTITFIQQWVAFFILVLLILFLIWLYFLLHLWNKNVDIKCSAHDALLE